MNNRALTTIAIRFAALLLFIKIFDSFGSYFLSIYYAAVIPFIEEHLHSSIDKFYYNGTFLIVTNILVSSILFFKAEWIASKLIKEDSNIINGMTAEKLIRAILLATGIIWFASSVYLLPDLFSYIQMIVAKVNHVKLTEKVDFSPIYYILKTAIALLFIFRVDKISLYLEKKMNASEGVQEKQHGDKDN